MVNLLPANIHPRHKDNMVHPQVHQDSMVRHHKAPRDNMVHHPQVHQGNMVPHHKALRDSMALPPNNRECMEHLPPPQVNTTRDRMGHHRLPVSNTAMVHHRHLVRI